MLTHECIYWSSTHVYCILYTHKLGSYHASLSVHFSFTQINQLFDDSTMILITVCQKFYLTPKALSVDFYFHSVVCSLAILWYDKQLFALPLSRKKFCVWKSLIEAVILRLSLSHKMSFIGFMTSYSFEKSRRLCASSHVNGFCATVNDLPCSTPSACACMVTSGTIQIISQLIHRPQLRQNHLV